MKTFNPVLGDLLKHEYTAPNAGNFCRESATIKSGEGELLIGSVLGKITKGSASAVAGGSNTGNGAMGSITVGAAAVAGVYTLLFLTATANKGQFELIDPSGNVVGLGNVASAFSGGGLSFTLADGAADFAVGDTFAITVAAGSGKLVLSDNTATDGSEDVYGILLSDIDATSADVVAAVLVRGPAIVAKDRLVFDATINLTAEKQAVYDALALKGIIVRDVA